MKNSMQIFRKVHEGESWTGSIIGYKFMRYRNLDDSEQTALRIGIYLGFMLIKIEFIRA